MIGELVGRTEEHQPRLAVAERLERLPHDDRLGARAADEPVHGAVVEDDALRAQMPGARRAPPDDGREREGATRLRQPHGLGKNAGVHQPVGACADSIADQTRSGSKGMSMLRTPRCASASMTALT